MQHFPQVKLTKVIHRSNQQIKIDFGFNNFLIERVREVNGVLWSKTLGAWYVANNSDNLKAILNTFKGYAIVDTSNFFKQNNQSKVKRDLTREKVKRKKIIRNLNLTSSDKKVLHAYVKYLRGKMLSESTVKTYYIHILDFINYLHGKKIDSLNNRDVEQFLEDVCVPRNYAVSTHRQIIGAIKHFKLLYPDCQIDEMLLELPRKTNFLPTVLSKQEIVLMLQHTKNLKHRAILSMIYSSGMRISELLNLQLRDIDINRNQIFIQNSKGRKDRYVMMAKSLLPLFHNYMITYKPQKYFAESLEAGTKFTASSIRNFLRRSCRSAGIIKRVTPHTLRHSYATHLMENGVDIRYIQELLGHSRPETTMIYTHVSTRDLMHIESPFDQIVKDLSSQDKSNEKLRLSGRFNL